MAGPVHRSAPDESGWCWSVSRCTVAAAADAAEGAGRASGAMEAPGHHPLVGSSASSSGRLACGAAGLGKCVSIACDQGLYVASPIEQPLSRPAPS